MSHLTASSPAGQPGWNKPKTWDLATHQQRNGDGWSPTSDQHSFAGSMTQR